MKKKDIFLIVGAVLMLVIAFFVVGETNANPEVEVPLVLSDEEVGLIEMDYDTYASKLSKGENFIVVIERTGCSFCEDYLPVLETVTNELGIPVYDIDIAELSEDEYDLLSKSNSYLKRENWGTPTTLLMSGEVVVDSISGYVDEVEFTDFVEKNIILSQEEDADVE